MSIRADKVVLLKAELDFETQELGDMAAQQVSTERDWLANHPEEPPFPDVVHPLVMKFRAVVAADEAETARIFPAPPPAGVPDWLKNLTVWDGKTPMVTAEKVRAHLYGVLTHSPCSSHLSKLLHCNER